MSRFGSFALIVSSLAGWAVAGPVPAALGQVNPPQQTPFMSDDFRRLIRQTEEDRKRRENLVPVFQTLQMHAAARQAQSPTVAGRSFFSGWGFKAAGCGFLAFLGWLFGRSMESKPPAPSRSSAAQPDPPRPWANPSPDRKPM
jgi:hypothetical protein